MIRPDSNARSHAHAHAFAYSATHIYYASYAPAAYVRDSFMVISTITHAQRVRCAAAAAVMGIGELIDFSAAPIGPPIRVGSSEARRELWRVNQTSF